MKREEPGLREERRSKEPRGDSRGRNPPRSERAKETKPGPKEQSKPVTKDQSKSTPKEQVKPAVKEQSKPG